MNAVWALKYYGGQHFPDLRDEHQYRAGEWIALQVSWLLRGYRLLPRLSPDDPAIRMQRVNVAKLRIARGLRRGS